MKMPAIHSASHLDTAVIAQLKERSNKRKGRGEGIGKKRGAGRRNKRRRGGVMKGSENDRERNMREWITGESAKIFKCRI